MKKKSIIWHVLPYYLLIILFSLILVSWYSSKAVRDFHEKDITRSLEERAIMVKLHLADLMSGPIVTNVDSLCDIYGERSDMRITVIDRKGRVIGDSEDDPARMENHSDRPEILKALSGSTGVSKRHSATLSQDFIYVAIPLDVGGEIKGTVRASIPLTEIEGSLSTMYKHLFMAGIITAMIAGLLSVFAARRISSPIEEVKKGIKHFDSGDLDYRIPAHGMAEIGELSRVINNMASSLSDRIDMVELQKSEQDAVFSAIPEGLLVVDRNERIIRINPGASELLGISVDKAVGKSIQELVRNRQLQKFVIDTLGGSGPAEVDFIINNNGTDIFVQARGVTMMSIDGNRSSAVIALNNVTRIKKLEDVRREFVANVSHELRTPVTAIKGFVETLMDGAIENKSDTRKFLAIIDRQADRMKRIIADLLMLAQVEKEEESGEIRFEKTDIGKVIDEARHLCSSKADARNIIIEVNCPDDLVAMVDPALLEQAIINLLDNALNYSGEGSKVTVKACKENGWLVIDVIDRGCGIEPQYSLKLFERFFRIDKARSRKLGGTGLGLSIVKHIVQVHDGRVSVESEPGKGSIFKIEIPLSS
ncbi:MAG: HAMP domain-containing protein [Candidatus Krumholzibacteriota bacterium]|nr:HAMP domain-containing protein [Candidatus Krumholzibacteriota bacterium]